MADESEAMAMMGVVGDDTAAAVANAATLFDYAMASSYNAAANNNETNNTNTTNDTNDTNTTATSAAATPTLTSPIPTAPPSHDASGTTDSASQAAGRAAPTPASMALALSMGMGLTSSVASSSPSTHATIPTGVATSGGGATTATLFTHELESELALPDKKTGRPSHPAWEHFVRGSKRNRFHHHAYCKYCSAHGVEPVPVRGVSGNMIRHLQRCLYCPEDIVLQLRVLCAQKDAVNYNKRHHHQSQPPLVGDMVDGMIQAAAATATATAACDGTGPSAVKKLKRAGDSVTVPAAAAAAGDVFVSMQVAAAAGRVPFVGKPATAATTKSKARQAAANYRTTNAAASAPALGTPHAAINQAALNRLVLRATLSGGLSLDWMSMEEACRLSAPSASADTTQPKGVVLPSRVAVYDKNLVASLTSSAYETHVSRMKEDASVGTTLTINYWFNKAERTNLMLFSLVNVHGEATAWKLVDVGTDDVTLEELATQIKHAVVALGEEGVSLIAIVTDNLLAYAAAKTAVATGEDSISPIAVLPSFEAFLVNAMGVILTISEAHLETMGHVIELVAAFSNARLRDTLRRECGDLEAALVLPSKDKWFSFIDCIDSVRQFEDMIKIIGLRVVIHQSEAAAVQRGDDSGDASASSKASSVLSGSVPDVPAHVLETIQNPQFWETVVSLSELMSPIKETYKVMLSHNATMQFSTASAIGYPHARSTSSTMMTFSLSDVFYQLGRMYQQYTAIVADWEENPSASRAVSHVRYLQEQVNKTWKLYDQPLMFLAYTLNYNMTAPLVARNLPALQWLSIGKYAKEYFRRWFCANASASLGARPSARSGSTLNEEASTQFLEDILAFKERKYPFDPESVCDFENPRAFYQLISDSNPLMHLFGTRLFSVATSVPQLARVVPGKSSVTRVATSACSQELLFPLLQVTLRGRTASRTQTAKQFMAALQNSARSGRRPSTSDSASVVSETDKDCIHSAGHGAGRSASSLLASTSASPTSGIWNDREWRLLAKQWKVEWEHEGNVGNVLDTVATLSTSTGTRLLADLVPLDQIFKEKLPSRLQQSREEEAVVDV